ncbi:MAG: 4-hydroxy-tetrahydrodipicolinate reductase [Alphaproteobacteria bacterium]
MSEPRKVVILGAAGRMGQALIRAVTGSEGLAVHAALEVADNPALGKDAGSIAGLDAIGVPITDNVLEALVKADAVIDFTRPEATVEIATLAAQARIAHVIGTTGFDEAQEAAIEAAARHATIVKAGNMSLGVNLVTGLIRQVAERLGTDWDIEIVEMHHRHKIDAPSGTALMMGEAAAQGRGVNLVDVSDRGRDGITGERKAGDIGFHALRGGSVIGEHTAIFAAENERVEISHKAEDRTIFARGAIAAVQWAFAGGEQKAPGLYNMADVLGL